MDQSKRRKTRIRKANRKIMLEMSQAVAAVVDAIDQQERLERAQKILDKK